MAIAIGQVRHVDKPWGGEEIFAVVEGRFVGKIIFVRAGESLSLQVHAEKDEVIALAQGAVALWHGDSVDSLVEFVMRPGQSVRIPPGTWHQVSATENSVLWEASTAAPGWREDVVRARDRYGRVGTSKP